MWKPWSRKTRGNAPAAASEFERVAWLHVNSAIAGNHLGHLRARAADFYQQRWQADTEAALEIARKDNPKARHSELKEASRPKFTEARVLGELLAAEAQQVASGVVARMFGAPAPAQASPSPDAGGS